MEIGAGGLTSHATQPLSTVTVPKEHDRQQAQVLDEARKVDQGTGQSTINSEDIFKAVEKLNNSAETFNYPLRFKVDDNNQGQVNVVNSKTGETVKTISQEKALNQAGQLNQAVGLVLDEYS